MTWPSEPSPGRLDRWLRELRRAVVWRRRLLAAGLLAGSMAFALQVLAPTPPPGVEVVVAAHDLAAGALLGSADVRVAHRPAPSLPAGALHSAVAVVGSPVASAVRRGEVLTDVRLVGPSSLRGLGPGLVATPVRVADAQAADLLHAGDVVDVLAAATTPDTVGGQARLVASSVRVLSVPREAEHGPTSSLADGALLLIATTAPTAERLAGAAVADRLSIVVHGP